MRLASWLQKVKEQIQFGRHLKIKALRQVLYIYAMIFLVWGLYRLLLPFPMILEETVLKPVIFLLPIVWMMRREKQSLGQTARSLGFNSDNLWFSIFLGLTLGMTYLVIAFLGRSAFAGLAAVRELADIKYRNIVLMLISLATALWEQTFFSGFLLLKFREILDNEWQSATLIATLFMLLHLPIILLDSGTECLFMLQHLGLLWFIGFGNSVLMLRTRNILAPIISHTFWSFTFQLLN